MDSKVDKNKVLDDFTKVDLEKGRNTYCDQIFGIYREKLKSAVENELKNRKLV